MSNGNWNSVDIKSDYRDCPKNLTKHVISNVYIYFLGEILGHPFKRGLLIVTMITIIRMAELEDLRGMRWPITIALLAVFAFFCLLLVGLPGLRWLYHYDKNQF